MKKTLTVTVLILLAWFGAWQLLAARPPAAAATADGPRLDPALLQRLDIAARDVALTFARAPFDDGPRLLLVSRYRNGRVRGIDLGRALPGSADDPVTLFNTHGYERLQTLRGAEIEVDARTLLLPYAGTASQIAAGVNYSAHGDEVEVDEVFLFPKQTVATTSRAPVPVRDHLLDYEIELGYLALQPLARGERPAFMGLVLASDYTDRAMLTRHVHLTDVSSGEGFTQGKSLDGSMPVGNLLVIPRDHASYSRTLQLELWRNGIKRQHAEPAQMRWDLQRILDESHARAATRWTWNGAPVALPIDNGRIPARTLMLSGTPDGVIFHPPTPRQLFLGLSETFFSLRWMQPRHVVEPFLREAYASGRYLQPGEGIVMRADRLGLIVNRIVAQ